MRERGREDAAIETDEQQTEETHEQPSRTRFVGGAIPPVQVAQADGEDKNVTELKRKVADLVKRRFGGDYKKAFDSYDQDHDGKVTKDEILNLLKDADVGNAFTRGAWADGVLKKLDLDKDAGVSWAEFESVFQGSARA